MPDFNFENAITLPDGKFVCGVDEAGRGPWAGPVVVAAVIFRDQNLPDLILEHLNDSKKLSEKRREELFGVVQEHSLWGIAQATVEEIDELNILQANFLAMRRAVKQLGASVGHALIDGNKTPGLSLPSTAIVKGDSKSFSIAGASILAKVTRDRIMIELDQANPGYGWSRNKGYGTAEHRVGLEFLGPCDAHRKSFSPIRNWGKNLA
jgi:ribonuclease HII